MKVTKVFEEKKCDFCGQTAQYDGRIRFGPWAYMCPKCFERHGIGLGLGVGQRLIVCEVNSSIQIETGHLSDTD